MNPPTADRASALDQWGIVDGVLVPPPGLTDAASGALLVGDAAGLVASEAIVRTSPDDFVRAQLSRRFGLVVIGAWAGQRSPEWCRMLVHTCVGHLLPAGLFVVAPTVAGQIAVYAPTTGLVACVDALDSGSRAWRRTARRTVHDLVADARRALRRVSAIELASALDRDDDIVVLDTRTPSDRDRHGVIPGAIHAPRTVLEWMADPSSGYGEASIGPDARVVVVCNEGYSSSLAAANLQHLGFDHATDLIGGMVAWIAAGLPVERPAGHHGLCLLPEER